jgi:hypothetical protein
MVGQDANSIAKQTEQIVRTQHNFDVRGKIVAAQHRPNFVFHKQNKREQTCFSLLRCNETKRPISATAMQAVRDRSFHPA